MPDEGTTERATTVDRRRFLAGVGAGVSALAGCGGDTSGTPTDADPGIGTGTPGTATAGGGRTASPTPTPRRAGGETTAYRFNPMGYTGADDLIEEQATLMDPEERKPIVKRVLARIWSDAPTAVTLYGNRLQIVNTRWAGWIRRVGGVVHTDSYLNLRRSDGEPGGRPIQGMPGAPESLNVLATGDVFSLEVLSRIYSRGTVLNPETLAFEPWVFEDWTLSPENAGTGRPTIVAELREGVTFSDGTPLTAEDVKFTVEYVTEQETAGTVAASQFESVESVEVDSSGGTTVSYFLSREDNAWFTSILGNVVLPKHVWENVPDYRSYAPEESSEGLVGSGPMTLADRDPGNWLELDMRPREELWQNGAAGWLDDDGPFVDGHRIEIFGSRTALERALLDGGIDVGYTGDGVSVDRAVEATRRESLEVKQSEDDGWEHFSFNLRRVPLDDPAFRQLLVALIDTDWIVEELKQGIGATAGSYATPIAYDDWRPPEPDELDGSYEGIPVPALEFPGEAGTFELETDGIEAARDFLVDHDRATHDYTWEEADLDGAAAPDGLALFVNGEPLTEAHTDNLGEPGQGPIEVGINPPQVDLVKARIAQQWTGALGRVGVPVEMEVQAFSSQFVEVFANEGFDVFGMSWNGINVNNDHYRQLFGRWGADLGY